MDLLVYPTLVSHFIDANHTSLEIIKSKSIGIIFIEDEQYIF